MSSFRRTLAAIVALASWSCGSTQPDATPQVAAIVVNPASSTLALNAQLPLQALVQNEAGELVPDASVTWTVENPTVASVSSAGVVTALALGTTQVAASARGKSGIATVTVQRTPVSSVVVLPDKVNAAIGSTTQLTAVAYDAGQNVLADRGMIWSTSDATVATVSGTGVVTAKGKGTAIITATAEGKSDASEFTVAPGAVSRVSVTPSTVSMASGDKLTLAASAQDASGTVLAGKTVLWASSDTRVATVAAGEVTALGSGTANITATVEGVSGTAGVTVAKLPVASVSVAAATVTIGAKATLLATVTDTKGNVVTDRPVTWTIAPSTVATIDAATGEVTGVAAGTATATATSEGKGGSATVTVTPVAVKSVTVAPATLSLAPTQTGTLTATVTDANNTVVTTRPVSWSSSDPLIASVSTTGVVTALLPGTATITASSGGQSGTAAVTVTAVPVASITVSPSSASIVQNATRTIDATTRDAAGNTLTGRTVTWTTSDATIASLSATSGQSVTVTGGVAGAATITATSEGKSVASTITVTLGAVARVQLTLQSTSIKERTQTGATAVVLDGNDQPLQGRTVTWNASGEATVAPSSSVTSTGANSAATTTVTAKDIGSSTKTATITATAGNRSDSKQLTVQP
jgi:uncharacterized protein YjdB